MKLALVTRRYPPMIGGAERVLSYLAEALVAEGAKVTVVTARMPSSGKLSELKRAAGPTHGGKPGGYVESSSGKLSELKRAAGPTHGGKPGGYVESNGPSVVRLETSALRFWGTWRYMRNLKRWLQENPVDLVYVSMLKHDAYVAIGAGVRSGFPVVLRPEGAGATGDMSWQSWGNFGRKIGLRCRRADAFVAISKSIEKELLEAWHTGAMRPAFMAEILRPTSGTPRIVPIPNGVPIPTTAWEPRPHWRAAPRAVFIGRLAPEKGLDCLIDAWPTVRATYPEAQLILYGDGPQRSLLQNKVSQLGLTLGPGRAVELAGVAAEPTQALREADLFLLPSREEGMSVALLEAMALGVPIVASSIPGNRRLMTDLVHGRLVPPDDHARLAQAVVEQWRDFDRATFLSRAARDRVEREFSIQAVARRHLVLFHDILAKRALIADADR
jgi:glycosyltransferase involved in cell wall biosynthesis